MCVCVCVESGSSLLASMGSALPSVALGSPTKLRAAEGGRSEKGEGRGAGKRPQPQGCV